MTESVSGSTALDNLTNSYVSTTEESTDETLGKEDFLILLVAQLENQDPLNPQDSTDFTSQLAQYSQLEQMMNLNETAEAFIESYSTGTEGDGMEYLGKTVTGNIDSLEVSDGTVTSGFYNLTSAADVMVDVYDSDGNKVDRIYSGQQESGGQILAWDGTDSAGDAVDDGKYTYVVYADYGSGYEQVETSVTGEVEGVTYNNGTSYLVVQGVLVSLDDVTAVSDLDSDNEAESALEYLGYEIKSDAPIVLVEGEAVYGGDLEFDLETVEGVTVTVYDAYDEEVNTISVDAEDLDEGTNSIYWNALNDSGSQMSDGLYYYTVQTESGEYLDTEVSGEVTAVKNVNGIQYLILEDSGRLVSLSNVEEIN